MWFRLIVTLFFLNNAFAELVYLDRDKVNQILIKKHQGIHTYPEEKDSIAQVKIRIYKKNKINFKIKNFDISPAAKRCHYLEGIPNVVYDEHLNEISICEFNDSSFFYSWDLFKIALRNNDND